MTTTCPRCAAQATGNFCSNCGATLAVQACPNCGATPEVGGRFCNHCGHALLLQGAMSGKASAGPGAGAGMAGTGRIGGGASRAAAPSAAETAASDRRMVWGLAAVFVVGIAMIVLLPILKKETTEAVPGGPLPEPIVGGNGAPSGTPPDISNMTPREAADRLFERVMEAYEGGNQPLAFQFMPMALQAYAIARPLDLDGVFHLGTLQLTNSDFPAALATAREGLETYPDHLLLLGLAADAATKAGDAATAKQYRAHFLQVSAGEMAKGLPEYGDHSRMIDIYQKAATSQP